MEYLFMAAALALFVVVIFLLEAYRAKKTEKQFIAKLYDGYLQLAEKNYAPERFEKIKSYYLRHREDGQIDDITWNDLGMDDIFKRMNYTLSASGEEYLYYTLRTLRQDGESAAHFEKVINAFGEHPEERVRFQFRMNQLGHTGKYSLYDYIENLDYLGERSSRKNIICDLLFLPFIALLWIWFPVGVAGIVVLMVYNIVSYFKEKAEIDPYITSFAYLIRLLNVCEELERLKQEELAGELARIREAGRTLRPLRKNSFWVMSAGNSRAGAASGDIIAVVTDYIRMVFHVDLIRFNGMLRFLREHIEETDRLISTVGYLETAVAVWSFRQSLENGWCLPTFLTGERVSLAGAYHPLLTKPVRNSIKAERGVLLTGSNASGKSTFLKTVAVNAVLAQTIHTCTAESYQAPFFHVYSSMALRDDINSGESYYIVEIKALKRILDAAASGERPVLCFVDEVLRGTNTVERIAASTQILKSLGGAGILCFAATHDIELTELLKDTYDNYHFEEEIRDGDISFPYMLQKGKATTRNAIKLLELLGYDSRIIRRAFIQAEGFLESGKWEALADA